MKKLLPFLLLASLPAATFATEPNIFAYALGGNLVSHKEYEFIYSLNTPATSVEIIIYNPDGTVAGTVPSTALDKGENKFTGELPQLEAGTYAWAVKATAAPTDGGQYVTPVNQKTVIGTGADLSWSRMRGVSVNINPETETFGTVYGTSGAYNESQLAKYCGAIVWTPLLDTDGKVYKGDVSWPQQSKDSENPSALNDAFASMDGNLYISDWTDNHSGVYMMYGSDPTAPFLNVFGGTRASSGLLTNENGAQIAGSVSGACTVGKGEALKLYTYDEDCNGGGIMRYDLGSKRTPWTNAPSKVIGRVFDYEGSTVSLKAGAGAHIRPDYNGGIWVAVNMSPNTYLLHFNADDVLDFCDTTLPQSIAGAISTTTDGSVLAISNATSGTSQFSFYNVYFDAKGKPTLNERIVADHSNKMDCYTKNVRSLAFDYAGNLYASTQGKAQTNTGLSMYVMPKADNSTTVKAIEPIVLSVSTGIADTFAASHLSYNGSLISADATVTVYSTTGLVVARGTQIPTTDFIPGIYIAKAGDETIKIIKNH